MDRVQGVFLKLVSEGLQENPKPIHEVSELSADELFYLYEMGRFHSISSILYDGLFACYQSGIQQVEPLLERISAEERSKTLGLYHIYDVTDQLLRELKEQDIPAVVLKGATVGTYYKMPEHRKSGDIDLWLFEVSDFKDDRFIKSVQILEKNGFFWNKEFETRHHRGFINQEGLEIELHIGFAEEFVDEERNNAVNRFINDIDRESFREVDIIGLYRFLSLSGADFVFYNLLHMVTHYVTKGFGWKFICDWAMILKKPLEKSEQTRLNRLLADAKLMDFAEAVSLLAIRYLGLEQDMVSYLLHGNITDEALQQFADLVFESGELGESHENRMLTPTQNGIKELLILFHLQMKKNFGKVSNIVILWPIFWAFTLVKFIYNNRHLRKVSTFAVIKDARDRAKLAEELNLLSR